MSAVRKIGLRLMHPHTSKREASIGGGPAREALVAAALLALVIAGAAALAPLWGLALFYVLASPGLGAILLSRGGLLAPAYD